MTCTPGANKVMLTMHCFTVTAGMCGCTDMRLEPFSHVCDSSWMPSTCGSSRMHSAARFLEPSVSQASSVLMQKMLLAKLSLWSTFAPAAMNPCKPLPRHSSTAGGSALSTVAWHAGPASHSSPEECARSGRYLTFPCSLSPCQTTSHRGQVLLQGRRPSRTSQRAARWLQPGCV